LALWDASSVSSRTRTRLDASRTRGFRRLIEDICLAVVSKCRPAHTFNVSVKAELRSHLSAQRSLPTAVGCSSHLFDCPFRAMASGDY
jgi:hypothetical protein